MRKAAEDRLLLLMRTGDQEAFRRLYETTAKGVYSYALSILKHPQDAEEVMQDTYMTAWNQAEQYRPEGKPMAWLLTIARNLCYMRLRKQLAQLSEEERKIVLLHDAGQMKHREIAEYLGCPLSTVLSKYRRALKKLQKLIDIGNEIKKFEKKG